MTQGITNQFSFVYTIFKSLFIYTAVIHIYCQLQIIITLLYIESMSLYFMIQYKGYLHRSLLATSKRVLVSHLDQHYTGNIDRPIYGLSAQFVCCKKQLITFIGLTPAQSKGGFHKLVPTLRETIFEINTRTILFFCLGFK